MLSAEIYENLDGLEYDSDEEFYKPRSKAMSPTQHTLLLSNPISAYATISVCLQIYTIEEIELDEDGNEIDTNVSPGIEPVTDIGIDIDQGQEDSEEGVSEGEDDDVVRALAAGSSKEMIELDAQQEEAYNLQTKIFDLKDELEKINCSKYYDILLDLGYGDLVSISYVSSLKSFLFHHLSISGCILLSNR